MGEAKRRREQGSERMVESTCRCDGVKELETYEEKLMVVLAGKGIFHERHNGKLRWKAADVERIKPLEFGVLAALGFDTRIDIQPLKPIVSEFELNAMIHGNTSELLRRITLAFDREGIVYRIVDPRTASWQAIERHDRRATEIEAKVSREFAKEMALELLRSKRP